ncbi:DUF4253 domain-containing protein [Streptosporangiaceae bacterium NEAU-GS5]|nr:DUF4253 domain-containing protein [Streptosporangiaceae bacterium NEAU-GS5]
MDGLTLPDEVRPLFADGGERRALSATLPPGAIVWPDPDYLRRAVDRPALWLSDDPVDGELWGRLRAEHEHSGLWPLLLEDSVQPWSAGQLAPDDPAEIGHYDPAAFMAEVWEDWFERSNEEQWETVAPFGRACPGLAPPAQLVADPSAVADWYACGLAERRTPLGLVVAERGADALAVMGWQGALHHNEWLAPLAAVVRGWEERFAARVVCLGFNTLDLSVAAPPASIDHALHVAAEHWTFCPDVILQGPGSLSAYAEELIGRHTWSFWWD